MILLKRLELIEKEKEVIDTDVIVIDKEKVEDPLFYFDEKGQYFIQPFCARMMTYNRKLKDVSIPILIETKEVQAMDIIPTTTTSTTTLTTTTPITLPTTAATSTTNTTTTPTTTTPITPTTTITLATTTTTTSPPIQTTLSQTTTEIDAAEKAKALRQLLQLVLNYIFFRSN